MTLQNKSAIVTGASRGIGAAIAKRLAKDGAHVFVNFSSSIESAQKVVDEIQTSHGRATLAQADISSSEGVRKLFNLFDESDCKTLDILVNNAGFFPQGTLEDSTEEDFDKVVNLNVKGVFLAAQEASRRMQKGGRIINIGSIFGERMPLPGVGLYTMSKFAVAGFTRAWARDMGPIGITVNCIQPGPIDTELNPADGEFAPMINPYTALGRYGTTGEIASLAAFLASDESSYITGACLNADGGVNA